MTHDRFGDSRFEEALLHMGTIAAERLDGSNITEVDKEILVRLYWSGAESNNRSLYYQWHWDINYALNTKDIEPIREILRKPNGRDARPCGTHRMRQAFPFTILLSREEQQNILRDFCTPPQIPIFSNRVPPVVPIWLSVPYEECAMAKSLAALWDSRERLWFAPTRYVADKCARWLLPRYRISLCVPDVDRATAVSRGAYQDESGALFVPVWHERPGWFQDWLPERHPDRQGDREQGFFDANQTKLERRVTRLHVYHFLPPDKYTTEERAAYERLILPRSLDPAELYKRFYGSKLYSVQWGFCGFCDSRVTASDICTGTGRNATHLRHVVGLRTEEVTILEQGVKDGKIRLLRGAS